MTHIDYTTDAAILALRTLVAGAVNYDLGFDAINTAFGSFQELGHIGKQNLPSISIYRASERASRLSSVELGGLVTIRLDYVTTPTPRDKLEDRWPVLANVWKSARNAMAAGKHPYVAEGADILWDSASLKVNEDELQSDRAMRVDYGFAPGDRAAYPYFRAQVTFEEWPDMPDPSALDTLLEIFTQYDLAPADGVIDAEDLITAEGSE